MVRRSFSTALRDEEEVLVYMHIPHTHFFCTFKFQVRLQYISHTS